jgi:uncharacterized protein (DUF58 family)
MLTDRGRAVLALGGVVYLAGWAFGSEALYPVAVGLVAAAAAAAGWTQLFRRPMRLRRRLSRTEHVDGDDVPVELELRPAGRLPVTSLVVVERIARIGEQRTVLRRASGGRLRGRYLLESLPRGRYPIEDARAVVEDPFGLARLEVPLPAADAVLVYPRLVDLERLFSEVGRHQLEGRRLLLRRPSGFDLHSVREYEAGESLRRVHWPTTAKRAQLMVKELEDAPRDETMVVLDADAGSVAGVAPDSSFEVQVRAAGSLLQAYARRGRRSALVVNGARRHYQRVHTYDGDWLRALELLAAVDADGHTPVASFLADEAGPAARALELAVVTASVTPRLVDRLLRRRLARHSATLVYVDAPSFAEAPPERVHAETAAQLVRLERSGVAVAVVRRGDDLAARLGASLRSDSSEREAVSAAG